MSPEKFNKFCNKNLILLDDIGLYDTFSNIMLHKTNYIYHVNEKHQYFHTVGWAAGRASGL